jgi:isoleucyl-tRNA synthetase
VLTHGFALDGQGRKMSKSVGNVVDPLAIIRDNGADILRLWVASTDYFEDVRIGKEVLAGTSDTLSQAAQHLPLPARRARSLCRRGRVEPRTCRSWERWVLHRLALLDAELREAAEGYELYR